MAKDEEVEIRRAPKILPWMLTGAVIGAVVALIFGLFTPDSPDIPENFVGLLLVSLSALGLGLGLGFAIIFDLVSSARAKRAIANRVTE